MPSMATRVLLKVPFPHELGGDVTYHGSICFLHDGYYTGDDRTITQCQDTLNEEQAELLTRLGAKASQGDPCPVLRTGIYGPRNGSCAFTVVRLAHNEDFWFAPFFTIDNHNRCLDHDLHRWSLMTFREWAVISASKRPNDGGACAAWEAFQMLDARRKIVVNMRPRMTSLTESEIDILASFLTETTADTASISVATDNKGNRTITYEETYETAADAYNRITVLPDDDGSTNETATASRLSEATTTSTTKK